MTNPKPSPGRLLSSTSTVFTPPLPSLATAPNAPPPPLMGGGPPALSSTPTQSRGSKVSVTGTESRKLVLWMRVEDGGPLGVCVGGAPKKQGIDFKEAGSQGGAGVSPLPCSRALGTGRGSYLGGLLRPEGVLPGDSPGPNRPG